MLSFQFPTTHLTHPSEVSSETPPPVGTEIEGLKTTSPPSSSSAHHPLLVPLSHCTYGLNPCSLFLVCVALGNVLNLPGSGL